MFSILHISDLHRSNDDPIDNDSLVAALLSDCDRYMGETPVVPSPNAIIVSGDLIQGAPIGHPGWEKEIVNQYQVAEFFLDNLTRRFLGGDRRRLIIVPGNHDVCRNTSLSSMERVVVSDYPKDVRKALLEPGSIYRWSWKELALYRIRDADGYGRRMVAYWNFVEKFYAGVPLLKPIDRSRDFQLFSLCDDQIVVAAFDSTFGNDCFSSAGAITGGAVARCSLAIRDIPHCFKLRIAVWHHSINGPPMSDDYMEIGQVHQMAGLHFQLGLHGHQHIAAATTHYVHLSETQSMAVVSAGSLCAGNKELPRGVNRQYNIIVLDDDMSRARVHVREMGDGEQFCRKNSGAFSQGYVELSWPKATDAMGRVIDADHENKRRVISEAEEAFHSGNERKAVELLENIELPAGSHGRRIAIDASVRLEDWALLIRILAEPQTVEEAVLLASAFIRTGALDEAEVILGKYEDIDLGTRNALEEQITTKRMMRGK